MTGIYEAYAIRRMSGGSHCEWFRLVQALLQVPQILVSWHDRVVERRMLLQLPDAILRDIGISRADVWREASKPFWRA